MRISVLMSSLAVVELTTATALERSICGADRTLKYATLAAT